MSENVITKERDPVAQALEDAIAHWKRFATGTANIDERPYARDCALCQLFYDNDDRCGGCPVRVRTGKHVCLDTPWHAASRAFEDHGVHSALFKNYAQQELEFLQSLRPAVSPQIIKGHDNSNATGAKLPDPDAKCEPPVSPISSSGPI